MIRDFKDFLRKGGFDNNIVDGSIHPAGLNDRVLIHLSHSSFEFSEEMFELVNVRDVPLKENQRTFWGLMNALVGDRTRLANLNTLSFLSVRLGLFPDSWKEKKILILGTVFSEFDPNRLPQDLRPVVKSMAFSSTQKAASFYHGNGPFYTGYHYAESDLPNEELYVLCLKR